MSLVTVASLSLGGWCSSLDQSGDAAGKVVVKTISISDQKVVMNWESYEGAGSCAKEWTAQARIDNGEAKVEQLAQVGPTGEGC